MARSFFRPRNTSCFLMDMRSTMSLGSNRDYFTIWAMYPALPCWKSQMEASLGRGAPSSTRGGAQAGTIACWSPLLSPSLEDLICMTLACLAPLWGLTSWEGWLFPTSTTSFPFCSIFLLWSVGTYWSGWLGGRVGSLVWAAFLGVFPPAWDSNSSWRVDLALCCIPMAY